MKNLSLISPLLPFVVCATAILASNAPAQALDFTFSFSNSGGTTPGTVSGTIYGLSDNTANQAATDIQITSYPSALGFGSTPFSVFTFGTPSSNSFSVVSGTITAADFYVYYNSPSVFQFFLLNHNSNNVLQNSSAYTYNAGGFSGATYSAVPVPFNIPGGATIPTLGSVLALGVMRKIRKFRTNTHPQPIKTAHNPTLHTTYL